MESYEDAWTDARGYRRLSEEQLSEQGLAVGGCSYLLPGPGNVIAHGHEEHDREPKHGADDHKLRTLGAVLAMHEEKHDERRFEGGDYEGDDDVQPVEIGIQVVLGRFNREERAHHQCREDRQVELRRDYVMLRMRVG